MRLIFSKNRPAQLDLLLRSLERYAPPEGTRVLWSADPEFMEGYVDLHLSTPPERNFNDDLRYELALGDNTKVTFFCDDDIVYREMPPSLEVPLLFENSRLLTFSLRLGVGNDTMLRPADFPLWHWPSCPRHDFGFPASIDGHTFRVSDVMRMIGDDVIENPTMLETIMAMRVQYLAEERPLMASGLFQRLVGVPVNRVSENSGVPFGQCFPQTTKELNDRWLAGERIVLDDIVDPAEVTGCHHEIQYRWEKRP